jgi:hypothetical protein
MMLTDEHIRAILRYILERSPYISGYRKFSDGKVRRYIQWLWAAERSAR